MIYATKNNFVGENIYGNFNKPYAHYITDEKLQKANQELQKLRPGWKFKIYDALRPHSCQIKLWNKVKGTDQQGYVMNPQYGSIHSFGFALDITLVDEKGQEVDMGTPVDSFKDLSQPRYEQKYLATGELTEAQYRNRQVLRQSMVKAGFQTISNEWWHFEALPGKQVRSSYPIFDF
jgi:D-alanyl-D-alanine dipeptidase